jgi:penicillin-binding protein 2
MPEKSFKHRLIVLRILAALSLLVIMGRLYYLQVYKGDYLVKKAEENMIRAIPISSERGAIMDRNGTILAKNSPRFTLSLLSFELRNPSTAVSILAERLSLKPAETKELLKKIQANPADPIKIGKPIDYRDLSRIAEVLGDFPGLYIESLPLREYPLKKTGCHITGYLGEISIEELEENSHGGYQIGDFVGKDGLEKEYDRKLRGQKGVKKVLVNVEGRMSRYIGEDPPQTGDLLILTLDSELQRISEEALEKTITAVRRKNGESSGGAVVVMGARNGEILSLVSSPGFDPNLFAKGISVKDYNKLISDKAFPLLNRTIHCTYPCASTYKMITGSAALQERLITKNSHFYCSGVYKAGEMPFNCFVRSGHGPISFIDAIAQSCDVVFYQLAARINLEHFLDYSKSFGIGTATGIDLPAETGGLLPTPAWKKKVYHEEWFIGDTINLSIGQGFVGVTPLQVAVATAAVANGGTIYQPHIIGQIISSEGKMIKNNEAVKMREVPVDPAHLETIREGMRGAVRYGTAVAANSSIIEIAGKTGTAENFPASDNPHGRNHTWFTSFAPYKDPEIVITVFVEKSGGFGGQWCAPVARTIAEAYMQKKKSRKESEAK